MKKMFSREKMAEREPKLETHEDAVNLVKAVFEQMGGKILADFEQKGGTILPPKRPLGTYRAYRGKAELLGLYAKMVNDGEGHMLHAEISECTRLKELYEERLRCLNERDPKLALVREGAVHLYDHYEAHFRMKIRANELGVEAATEVLNKWQTEELDSKKSTMTRGDQEPKPSDLQSGERVCK